MAVNAAEDPAVQLARRLRALRLQGLAGRRLTQPDLAEAFGASVPLISSWESKRKPKAPPQERLEAYATFFATERSIAESPFQVLPKTQLTPEERARREELLQELTDLRNGADRYGAEAPAADPFAGNHWRFPPDEDITIVCSALPSEYLSSVPYADPEAPDYVDLYKYADLDALLELFGHLRAANPLSNVGIRTPDGVRPHEYTSHLVLLGGVDFNKVTEELLRRLAVPVRQLPRESDDVPGGFQVGDDKQMFTPELRRVNGKETLVADVAHFFRAPSPLNDKRTISICNGSFQRGTYGAVRALTDARFRDRNERHLRTRFAGTDTFSIISRVEVFLSAAVTPDWTKPEDLLHEWPPAE
jgi:transcriptional regulator with XRE-family HTH domain